MKRLLYAIAFAATLASCSIQDVDLVRVNNVFPQEVLGDAPRLNVNVTLDNPNKFNIKVKKAKINLSVNGNDAGDIKLGDAVLIKKLKKGDYDFILIGDKEKIVNAIKKAGLSVALSGKVMVSLKGWVKGKAFGLGKKIRVDEKKSFSLSDLGIKL